MSPIESEIEKYYRKGMESGRLTGVLGELERLRTQAILARNLPPPPKTILDVGGAAGVHAFPLAKLGYQVHLIDPVELHLQQARDESAAWISLPAVRMRFFFSGRFTICPAMRIACKRFAKRAAFSRPRASSLQPQSAALPH
jgi:hypothetical protein